MAQTNQWPWIAVAFLALAGCSPGVDKSTTWWEDAFCANPPEYRPPVVSTAFVGLFLEDGTPLCRDDAAVTLVQHLPAPYEDHRAVLPYSATYFARVTDDWAMHMFSSGDGPCNAYAPATPDYAWLRCGPPLQYDVRVEGCEPVSGTFTWNDNWFPWKNSADITANRDWFVPVRMRCSDARDASMPVDASVAPDAAVPSDASGP